MSMFSVAQSGSQIPALIAARTSAAGIFSIIDRVISLLDNSRIIQIFKEPEIDTDSAKGIKPERSNGRIEINDVRFRYASRPDVEVLKGVSLKAEPGQVIALVGHSGSGMLK